MDNHQLRRKLIKGSLAAPLVLTVGKAGASSRTTFTGSCAASTELKPEPRAAVAQPDEAFRVTREVYEIYRRPDRDNARSQKVDGEYVLGWDNQSLYRIDGAGMARQYDNSPGFVARGLDVEMRRTGRSVEVLAYLDENGNVIGLAPQRNGGTWTMKSCYASFVGMPRDNTQGFRRLFG
jgi:hypothetical protein